MKPTGRTKPITVLVARRVRPGKEVEFERWASELTRAASAFDGFLGAGLLRPGHVGELWHVVYRFASADELAQWEQSPTRSELLAHGEEVMSTSHERRMTGLETWFEVPGRTAPAPPSWKMFVVTSIVSDPKYLTGPYTSTVPFKKIPDRAGWDPTPCRADEPR